MKDTNRKANFGHVRALAEFLQRLRAHNYKGAFVALDHTNPQLRGRRARHAKK